MKALYILPLFLCSLVTIAGISPAPCDGSWKQSCGLDQARNSVGCDLNYDKEGKYSCPAKHFDGSDESVEIDAKTNSLVLVKTCSWYKYEEVKKLCKEHKKLQNCGGVLKKEPGSCG